MPATHNSRLHVQVDGSGERTIVLLHELGGSMKSWDRVVERLGSDFTILRYDMRGAGLSAKVMSEYGPDDLVEDLDSVIQMSGERTPVGLAAAAGSSATAVLFANRFPTLVSALLLCAPALGTAPSAREAAMARAAAVETNGMESIGIMAMDRMYPEPLRDAFFEPYRTRFLANDPVGFAQANRAFARTDVAADLITHKALFLAGDLDIRPIETVAVMAAEARAEHIVVPKAGHIMPWQAPDAVAGHIRHFFG